MSPYALRDPHGDVVGRVSSTAANTSTVAYDPWGGVLSTTGTGQGLLGYQGDLTDQVTKQVDMGTRWYSPGLGRFSSRDVVFGELSSPMSLNQHVYAGMNPITMWDPTGMLTVAGNDKEQEDAEGYSGYTQCQGSGGSGCSDAWADSPYTHDDGPSVEAPDPQIRLSLSDFDQMTEGQRLDWLDSFVAWSGSGSWFDAIRGVIQAGNAIDGSAAGGGFMDPGSWSSMVDAAILQGIQHGFLLHSGFIRGSANPGALLWSQFFSSRATADEVALKSQWSAAETVSTHYGAAKAGGRTANSGEMAVYDLGEFFRSTMSAGTDPVGSFMTPGGPALAGIYGMAPTAFDPRSSSVSAQWQVMVAWAAGMSNP